MSILTNRVIFKDSTTATDLSVELNNADSKTGTVNIVVADSDALYFGSELPFNARYIRVSTANDQASVVSVEYFDGSSSFVSAVDVIDETSSGGNTLAQSGWISWKSDKDEGNPGKQDTDDMPTTEFLQSSGLKIYDLYWVKLTFSADLKSTTALSYVGYKFCEDEDIGALYPQLNTSDIKGQFSTGKTDWDEQIIHASDMIVRDLKNDNRYREFVSRNQILDPEQLNHACVYKTARLIFNEFGDDSKDEFERAQRLYKEALDTVLRLDLDGDVRLDQGEFIKTGSFKRR